MSATTGAGSARPSALERPVLLVVVDTEEEFDWHGAFDRRNRSVAHLRRIDAFQAVCDGAGVRPVYVVTHPVATDPDGFEPLSAIRAGGRCEIGAHLHPWVTPPFEEVVNARNSYPGNLPRDLERRKLAALRDAIEAGFGARPTVYKAGRWGLGPDTPAILEELGFEVDLSPCPAFDFSADGGPDWSAERAEPRFIGPGGRVLQVPASGAFVGFASARGPALHRFATRSAPGWMRIPGILSRTGALERLLLSPEGYPPSDQRRLTRALLGRGARVLVFSLHSTSIQPGCAPYVRTERELVQFLDACRRYFDFFRDELRGVTMTATELARALEQAPHTPTA